MTLVRIIHYARTLISYGLKELAIDKSIRIKDKRTQRLLLSELDLEEEVIAARVKPDARDIELANSMNTERALSCVTGFGF